MNDQQWEELVQNFIDNYDDQVIDLSDDDTSDINEDLYNEIK